MITHAFTEYLKYKRKAMGRHGTHSPFVYDLVDNALLKNIHYPHSDEALQPILQQSFPAHYKDAICKIALHYSCKNIACVAVPGSYLITADLLWINTNDEKKWPEIFDAAVPSLGEYSIVIVSNIHTTPAHTAAWQQLCNNTSVRMSIDMYRIGMLLFRKEFKIKQSFVLKTR